MKYPSWLTIGLTTALSLSVIAPAIAQDTSTPTETSTPDRTESTSSDSSQTVKGTIKSIIGSLVIIDLPNGGTRTLTVSREHIARYNLAPGMYLVASEKNGMTMVESASYAAVASSESSTASRILSIKMPEVRSESSSSTTESSTTYTESAPPPATTAPVETTETAPPPEPLPSTPRALW